MSSILVVDDNADNRFVIGQLLQLSGYTVIHARGGHDAIQVASREIPQLILMDLSMPDMDGWMATKKIKEIATLTHIPVIAVTGHVTQDELDRAFKVGCSDFLSKPVEYERLIGKVSRFVQPQGIPLSPTI